MLHLSRAEAEGFYAVHKRRPFFEDLVKFMISGPVMVQVLEGESAIAKNRELMGATDPKKADKGTIRADFADSIDANAVHGSDARGHRAKWKSPTSSRRWTSTRAETPGQPMTPNLARLRRRAADRFLRRESAKSRFAPSSCCAGCTSAAGDFDAHERPGEAAARQARARAPCIEAPQIVADATVRRRHAQMADGRGQWQRGRDRVHPRGRTAARCAFPRRPAARSTAGSAPPANRASTAT